MRIIGGQAKGVRLKTLKGNSTRPTSDRVKESIFNILAFQIHGSRVLDLFSGTGNLGLESVSRGAEIAYLVENDKKASKIIQENINKTKLNKNIKLLIDDVINGIKYLSDKNERFDIIFMDPPYSKGFITPIIESIFKNNLLSTNGIVVVEHDKNDSIPGKIGNLVNYRDKKYGNTIVSFYTKED